MLSPMFLFMFKLINKNKAARKSHEKTKRIAFKIAFFCTLSNYHVAIMDKSKAKARFHISYIGSSLLKKAVTTLPTRYTNDLQTCINSL